MRALLLVTLAGAVGCAWAACAPASRPPMSAGPGAPAVDGASATLARPGACVGPAPVSAEEEDQTEPPPEGSGRHATPENAADTCAVADSNLRAAEAAIVAAPRAAGARPPRSAWDRARAPARLDRIDRRFALTADERARLAANGFVVPARLEYATYAWALHDVYQSELPLYVSADSILHAVYASNDKLIAHLETKLLAPALDRALAAMHCALPSAAADYPPEVARDLDLYLTVARTLLADKPIPSVLGADAEADALVTAAKKAEGMSTLEIFGRARTIDFSQLLPRGHYDAPASGGNPDERPLAPYFRAAMWLARLEWNVVSRSSRSSQPAPSPDPRETPREAVDALAVADLVERSGAMGDVTALDRAWSLLAGRREDVSIAELSRIRKEAHIERLVIPGAADALKRAIGDKYTRTTRTHFMPEGSKELPVIATFLGPRITPDSAATRPLVHDETLDRHMVTAADMAYALGHDRAKTYLAPELARFPALGVQLDKARAIVSAPLGGDDLYSAWLGAVRALAERPSGITPSFMETGAFADLRIDSAVSAYGQLRHNYVLMAGQPYDEGGCKIPDGYLDPVPRVYARIAAYADRGAKALAAIDPKDGAHAAPYFAELAKIARVLERIAEDELDGRALTPEEQRFLAMVVEMSPGSTGSAPTFTGWYFDMFRGRSEEALASADFVADYFTSGWDGKVAYVGASSPRLGVFVVDTGGSPRAVVGPVARAYELDGPIAKRLTDATALAAPNKRDPWAASYTALAPPAPSFVLKGAMDEEEMPGRPPHQVELELETTKALGPVTVELLDHHHRPLATLTRDVRRAGKTIYAFPVRRGPNVEGVHVKIGTFSAWTFRTLMDTYADIRAGTMAASSGETE